MKTLAFEGEFLLDTEPCPRCDGSGQFAHASRTMPPACHNCRGLGRKPTSEALQLFYRICEHLGRPFTAQTREGRLEPKHLRHIWARDVKPGMYVAEVKPRARADWPRVVESIEELPLGHRRLHYIDGSVQVLSSFALLTRELTDAEVTRVQAFLSQYVGRGAVKAESTPPEPTRAFSIAS